MYAPHPSPPIHLFPSSPAQSFSPLSPHIYPICRGPRWDAPSTLTRARSQSHLRQQPPPSPCPHPQAPHLTHLIPSHPSTPHPIPPHHPHSVHLIPSHPPPSSHPIISPNSSHPHLISSPSHLPTSALVASSIFIIHRRCLQGPYQVSQGADQSNLNNWGTRQPVVAQSWAAQAVSHRRTRRWSKFRFSSPII